MWLDPIDVPWRWSLRRRVERSGDAGSGLIQLGRPPLVRPGLSKARQGDRVGLPRSSPSATTSASRIETASTARIASDVAALPGTRPRWNQKFSSSQSAPTAVTCGLRSSLSVESHVVRALWASEAGGHPESSFSTSSPTQHWQSVRRTQVDDFHFISLLVGDTTRVRCRPSDV